MNPTPQPIAPDLQASLRHLRRIVLGGAAALLLLAGAAGYAAPAHAAGSGGKVGEVPVVTGIAGDPSQWGLATGKDPEIPVTPTLTRKVNEYEGQHRLAADEPAPERPKGGCGACH